MKIQTKMQTEMKNITVDNMSKYDFFLSIFNMWCFKRGIT